jgi:hypothetical protein
MVTKKMTPAERLAAARAAKKTGGAKKAPAKKRKIPTFQAPGDFKPCFLEVRFLTGADGLITNSQVLRVKGRWDNAEAQRFDLKEYDAGTQAALMARLCGRYFAVNAAKRLPPKSQFFLVIRVAQNKAEGTLRARIAAVAKIVKSEKTGKMVKQWFNREKETHKKDPVFRKLRSANRFLAGAFTGIQLPPSRRKTKEAADE